MEISLTQQCQSFLWALALGGGLSFFYDGFRFLRLLLPERRGMSEPAAYQAVQALARKKGLGLEQAAREILEGREAL